MPRGRQETNTTPWPDRFWAMVDKTGPEGCWIWTGYTEPKGYGKFSFRRSTSSTKQETWRVHRLAYTLLVGEIPEGLQLDHLCRVRSCVNPDHLEPVTNEENAWRGEAPTIVASRRGVCLRGHSLDDALIDHRGRRACRTCNSERNRRTSWKRTAAAAALREVRELVCHVAADARRLDPTLSDIEVTAVERFASDVLDLINKTTAAPAATGRRS